MPHPAADRNLLFGILAVQMEFVSRDDLIGAMNAWVLDKTKPLGQVLREQSKLGDDEHALLDGLVRKHLEKHDNDPEKSLAAVSSVYPVPDDLQQIADPDLQASLAHTSRCRAASDPEATRADTASPASHRFMRLRSHARGGLGDVFVARDEELHREVALKEIQERHADNLEYRVRFVQEAEVTGGLEHPGIVPVYSLGSYADGRPFYAMRFIQGDNLKDAIALFHQEKEALPTGVRTLRLRQLLGRFVAVCNTVAYAHSRGVIHRDLKPSNIMLGKYGETLVVDWGLAKLLDQAEADTPEVPLRASRGGDSGMTQTGAALGTPAYMSPEQAEGRLDRLGPRSDVYSLGATLYCLLTGQAPFASGEAAEVLARVRRGDYPQPRDLDRQIHPALESVCRRAMALRPEDRYPSPQALAEDVEKYLADEPVAAWREPWRVKARRWLGRHRTLVTATAATVLVATGALAVATLLLHAAYQREHNAREEAAKRGTEARDQRDQSARAFLRLADLTAERASRSDAIKLYEQVLETVGNLARDNPDVTEYQADLARGHNSLGRLYADTGKRGPSEEACHAAIAIWEALTRAHPDVPDYLNDLATTYTNLADMYQKTGGPKQAEEAYGKALAILEPLVRDHPDATDFKKRLAGAHNNLSLLYQDAGQLKQAEQSFNRVLALDEQLTHDHPAEPAHQAHLAKIVNNLGKLYETTGRPGQAEEAYKKALAILETLTRDHPAVTDYQHVRAQTYDFLGLLYSSSNRPDQAEELHEKARAIWAQLARENPLVTDFQGSLASVESNLGNVYYFTNRFPQAEAAYQKAIDLNEGVVRDNPDRVFCRMLLGRMHNNLGLACARQPAKRDRAEQAYRKSQEILELVAHDYPTDVECHFELAMCHSNLARLYEVAGKRGPALEAYQKAQALLDSWIRAHPADPNHRFLERLAETDNTLGLRYADAGDARTGQKWLEQALAAWEKLHAEHPEVNAYGVGLAGTCVNLGSHAADAGTPGGGLALYERAIAVLDPVRQRDPKDPRARSYLRNARLMRAQALGGVGRFAEAVQDCDQAIELEGAGSHEMSRMMRAMLAVQGGDHARAAAEATALSERASSWGLLYEMARVDALAARAVTRDTALAKADRDRLAGEYAARAVELLRRAVARGYRDVDHLKNDRALASLHQLDDYQKLVTELEAKAKDRK
jgi:serine/threonine-protein kinase